MKILIERNQLLLKKLGLALFDMFAVVVSSLLALVLRFEGNYSAIPREYIDRSLQYISIVMVVTLIIFYVLRLYGSLWSYAGATEFMNIIIASVLSSGVQMAVIVLMDMKMPRSYYVFYGMCLFGMVAVSRYSYRVLRTVAKRQKDSQNRTNVLIMGAGGAGNMLVLFSQDDFELQSACQVLELEPFLTISNWIIALCVVKIIITACLH